MSNEAASPRDLVVRVRLQVQGSFSRDLILPATVLEGVRIRRNLITTKEGQKKQKVPGQWAFSGLRFTHLIHLLAVSVVTDDVVL